MSAPSPRPGDQSKYRYKTSEELIAWRRQLRLSVDLALVEYRDLFNRGQLQLAQDHYARVIWPLRGAIGRISTILRDRWADPD